MSALPVLHKSSARPENQKASVLQLDPRTYARGMACVHCGLCLPACPTYTQNQNEADSPRGRIQLMLGLADGVIEPTESVRRHLDLCLDCRGCEPACPSGVVYHELIEETRTRLNASAPRGVNDRLLRWMFFHILTHPTRLKLALLPLRILQKLHLGGSIQWTTRLPLLPSGFRKMIEMLPPSGPAWPASAIHVGRASARHVSSPNEIGGLKPALHDVAFFNGCIGSVLFGDVNQKAAELLSAAGAKVTSPAAQICCGAIHEHNSDIESARRFARRNIDAFLSANGPRPKFIVTTVAGCGAMLRQYDHLLRDDEQYAARAKEFSSRVRDISEALISLQPLPLEHAIDEDVTYHDACHLAHAQGVTAQPRQLLSSIPGLRLIPLPESDICCGAAGTYNLTEPEMSRQLATRKLSNIASTGCRICMTGNAGCAMQIQSAAKSSALDLQVLHPVELLHASVFGVASPRVARRLLHRTHQS